MAKIWQISDGRSYVVNGDPGTTVTYTDSPSNGTAAGKQAARIPSGATSVTFPSNGAEVEISSDAATIDQVFSADCACSGSSSGGGGSAGGVTFQVVETLPEQGEEGVIYLVKVSETGDDKFEEWIWVDSAWESIGTTAVDPTTYAKLVGGNTFEGDQVINGSLTVVGGTTEVAELNYEVEDAWVGYTGTEIIFRSTAEDGTHTQLYFAGANTPLANIYEGGEAMMGYVVKHANTQEIIASGTQKLSVLFPNNQGENAFNPSSLDLPQ